MGGVVSVVVRMPDHKQYRMRWGTAALRNIKIPGWLQLDPNFWDWPAAFARWEEDKQTLAPADYGLVVVDHVSKRIISRQGYMSLAWMDIHTLKLMEIMGRVQDAERWFGGMEDQWRVASVRSCVSREDRVARYGERYVSSDAAIEAKYWTREDPLESFGSTLEAAIKEVLRHPRAGRNTSVEDDVAEGMAPVGCLPWRITGIAANWSPFEVDEAFDADALGWRNLKAELSGMGFSFNAEEDAAWESWCSQCHRIETLGL